MQLTVCELNAENLFISLDYYEGQALSRISEAEWKALAVAQLQRWQKPLRKLWGLAAAIQDINPDVLLLIEVGGRESLEHFNRLFLGDRFETHFVESNSPRSIDLAFLVRRELPLTARAVSNRHLPIEVEAYQGRFAGKFSRDVAELRLFRGPDLRLILLLTHLKSKLGSDHDFQGKNVRRAEAAALAAHYAKLRKKHKQIPLIVAGDFNSDLASPELELLARTDLTDFHDVLGTPPAERVSLVHFDHRGQPVPQVLDYILISPELRSKVLPESSGTYRYKSFHEVPHPLPETLAERYQLPSDHYPLVLKLTLD